MIRVWGIVRKGGKMHADMIVQCESGGADGLQDALKQVCKTFDLPMPIVLGKHVGEYERFFRTRFRADDFLEDFPFEALEIEQLRESKKRSQRNPLYD